MPLPRRPAPWILALLLLLLGLLTAWLFQALTSLERPRLTLSKSLPGKQASPPAVPPPSSVPPTVDIDPNNKALADELNAPGNTPERDLEIVNDFINLYRKALGSNPVGNNEDITAALTGNFGQTGRVFPPKNAAIKGGQLVDRWGTPLWFHAESGIKMEIRSAGPDKSLFTPDDICINK